MAVACVSCSSADTWLSRHVCSACGTPQPLDLSREDYFTALGAERAFSQDRALLERRFYEASRALHPDRFSGSSASARQASLERMSFLNEAWRTLKSPDELRVYLLKLWGVDSAEGTQGRASIPAELAEGWFELQDALAEDPASAAVKLRAFESELSALKTALASRISGIELELDAAPGPDKPRDLLVRLQAEIRLKSYVNSLERDIDRIRRKL